jgi:hypothetical protein
MIHRFFTVVLVVCAAAIPAVALATVELFLEGPPVVRPNVPIPVLLKARLEEPINALKTVVRFDPSRLAITAADDQGSVVRYWLSRPGASASGSMAVEGVIPGGVGPGFTDTVLIARLTVVFPRTGPATLRLDDSLVYLNQPNPQEARVILRPLTVTVRTDAPDVAMIGDAGVEEDAAVKIVSEPHLNNGAWSLVFDVRDNQGTASIRVRERRFGLAGQWHVADNPYRLSDQWLTSIIEVGVASGASQTVVKTIVPGRLQSIIALLVVGLAALAARRFRLLG